MRMHMRTICLALLAILLAACDDWDFDSGGRYRQDFHFSYPLTAGGSVQLENSNGSVEISGWDQNTVDIDGTKYAGTEERLREIRIDVTPSPNAIAIRTVPPFDRHGSYGARYVIHVPRRTDLANIVSSNGSIRVETIEGPAYLKTSNGSVHASQIQGSLDIQTSNGSVDAYSVTGDTKLRTSNGSIRAEVRKGVFEATTSNGAIEARVMEPDANQVRLESTNGHIDLTLEAVREVHADTSNSSITVHLPESAGANLRARTSNSSINSDFDVTVHGGIVSRNRLEGAIGAGGPTLDLETRNGRINLMKL